MVHKLAPPDDDDGTREPWYKLQCVRMFIWGAAVYMCTSFHKSLYFYGATHSRILTKRALKINLLITAWLAGGIIAISPTTMSCGLLIWSSASICILLFRISIDNHVE